MPQLSFYQWFIFATFTVNIIPVCIGGFGYKKLSPALRYIFFLALGSFVLDAIGRTLWINSRSNLFIGHFHTLVEFLLLANAFRIALNGFVSNKVMQFIMLGFAILAVLNTIFVQTLEFNNSYIKLFESLLFISFSLLYFYRLGKEMKIANLEMDPMFWISTGVLIYFAGSFFIFLYANFILLYTQELGIRIWFVHAIFFLLFGLLNSIGLWISQKK